MLKRRGILEFQELTVKNSLACYFEELRRRNTSENTLKTYDLHLKRYIDVLEIAEESVKVCNKRSYENFIDCLQEEMKDVTLTSYCRTIRAFLYWVQREGYVEEEKMSLPKYDKRIKETYSSEEMIKLLRKPEKRCSEVEYQTWVFINLILSTGLRLTSALECKVSQFVAKDKVLYVQKTKQRKAQTLLLNDEMIAILHKYILVFGLKEEDYIFCTASGKRLAKRSMQDNVATYNHSRGVNKTSVHLMRHTFAKNFYMQTKDIYSLQKILGHTSISTTEIYLQDLGLIEENATAYNPQILYGERERKRRGKLQDKKNSRMI